MLNINLNQKFSRFDVNTNFTNRKSKEISYKIHNYLTLQVETVTEQINILGFIE